MRKYYDIIDEMIRTTFDDAVIYDTTDIYDRAIFTMIDSLTRYYFDILAFTEKNERENRAQTLIHQIHDIACYNFDSIEFMCLCDVLNKINAYYELQFEIDFDDYNDLDNAVFFFRTYEFRRICRKTDSFYCYDYSNINIIAYTAQYMRMYF